MTQATATKTAQTVVFENRLPLRIAGDAEEAELWLGYVQLDFGGRYLEARKNRKGEWLIWYHFNPAYSNQNSWNRFIVRARPGGDTDIIHYFPTREDEYGEGYTDHERGYIQEWLEKLGLSKVEEF